MTVSTGFGNAKKGPTSLHERVGKTGPLVSEITPKTPSRGKKGKALTKKRRATWKGESHASAGGDTFSYIKRKEVRREGNRILEGTSSRANFNNRKKVHIGS